MASRRVDTPATATNSIHISTDTEIMKEHVLLVPPKLTQSAYGLLVKHNMVAKRWHLEGRYGSRTFRPEHRPDRMALPILTSAAECIKSRSDKSTNDIDIDSELEELLSNPGVEVDQCIVPHPSNAPKPEHIDATVHPERKPAEVPRLRRFPKPSKAAHRQKHDDVDADFTFMELFSGIGGFGVALEALGGRCLFASEINPRCNEIYLHNLLHQPEGGVHGDINQVLDSAFPKPGECDLLVAGFPCQPFSRLGAQPGFEDGDRGMLYTQIVRALRVSRPRGFLLENVPGLAAMGDSLEEIVKSLEEIGFDVFVEVVTARGLTAQSRKRLFFVGVQRNNDEDETKRESKNRSFEFPYIPDLGLRASDIIEYNDNDCEDHCDSASKFDKCRLTSAQMEQLINRSKKWKPSKLAWPDKVLDVLDGHYGITPGKGNSQLVPGSASAQHNPRLFTPRECARVMGFPYWFSPPTPDKNNGAEFKAKESDDDDVADRSYRKRLYLMFGNAVCPPLIAALAGAVLAECKDVAMKDATLTTHNKSHKRKREIDWRKIGLEMSISLALESVIKERQEAIVRRLVGSGRVVT